MQVELAKLESIINYEVRATVLFLFRKSLIYQLIIVAAFLFTTIAEAKLYPPTHLMTDLLEHTDSLSQNGYPLDKGVWEWTAGMQAPEIRSKHPRLGWQIVSSDNDVRQTAWRILIASSPTLLYEGVADVWDSQRQTGSQSVSVPTNGSELQGGKTYWWKVKVWDNHGNSSPYSSPKAFRTAHILDDGFPVYPLQKHPQSPSHRSLPFQFTLSEVEGEEPQLSIINNQISIKRSFFDFGKAAFAQLKLTLTSNRENDTVTVHLGEAACDGKINRTPGASIRYTSYQLPLQQGRHTYSINLRPDSRNTNPNANESGVHPILMPSYIGEVYPFRFVEIEGYDGELSTEDVTRIAVNYPFNDNEAYFHSSDSNLNKVWELCKHTIKATTFCGLYVDGDRERIPYEADAYINQLSHYATDREYSMARNTIEHLLHNPTWPTEWILLTPIMAWNDYLYTADDRLLRKYYELLKNHTLVELKQSVTTPHSKKHSPISSLISTRTGKVTQELKQKLSYKGKNIRDIVDWPQSGAFGIGKEKAGEADGYRFSDYNTVVNAYHYQALKVMALIAQTLSHHDDAKTFRKEARRVAKAINTLLYDKQNARYIDGIPSPKSVTTPTKRNNHQYKKQETRNQKPQTRNQSASLHANMFPLCFGLVPEKEQHSVIQFIHSRKMACSVYGAQFLLDALYNTNDAQYALQLMTADNQRSWISMLQQGSTITLEAWHPDYKPNLDWNHAWGAAPANIISRQLMGVQPLMPGFQKVRIAPQIATLTHANAVIPTIRGNIKLNIKQTPGESYHIHITLPPNMQAELQLPTFNNKHKNGKTVNLPSGTYHIHITPTNPAPVIQNITQ